MRKNCTCGGSNENCYKCSGKGWIDDEDHAPLPITFHPIYRSSTNYRSSTKLTTLDKNTSKKIKKTEPSSQKENIHLATESLGPQDKIKHHPHKPTVDVKRCDICGEVVFGKMKTHKKKAHGVSKKRRGRMRVFINEKPSKKQAADQAVDRFSLVADRKEKPLPNLPKKKINTCNQKERMANNKNRTQVSLQNTNVIEQPNSQNRSSQQGKPSHEHHLDAKRPYYDAGFRDPDGKFLSSTSWDRMDDDSSP